MATNPTPGSQIDLGNLQGNVLRGYTHPAVRFEFIHFNEAVAAREWLREMIGHVTTSEPWEEKPPTCVNVMFTASGLKALGLADESLKSFPVEFLAGMAGRAARLGDIGANAPANWEPHYGTGEIHAVVSLYALNDDLLAERSAWLADVTSRAGQVLFQQDANRLSCVDARGNTRYPEHFGFVDGIGQPAIEGQEAAPGCGSPEADGSWKSLARGEFVLGPPNQDGLFPPGPRPMELLRDGTYCAFRKIEQDVALFRRYIREHGEHVNGGEEWVAAKMMGRWRDGSPVELCPHAPDPDLAADDRRNNNFRYANDPRGYRCPLGAHNRRANPRDALPFGASMVNGHRIIRRGIPYGPPLADGLLENDGVERGFLFICFQADIGQQFEFVQGLWLHDGNKFQLPDDRDPIVGIQPPEAKHIVQGAPPVFLSPLPSFTRVRDGEYLFRPGITGLRYLSAG